MGLGVSELLLILVIVVMIFGTSKLKNLGGDLGGAIRSFKHSMNEADQDDRRPADQNQSAAAKSSVADNIDTHS
jgi:sec-independent protein translocase protein TatA